MFWFDQLIASQNGTLRKALFIRLFASFLELDVLSSLGFRRKLGNGYTWKNIYVNSTQIVFAK